MLWENFNRWVLVLVLVAHYCSSEASQLFGADDWCARATMDTATAQYNTLGPPKKELVIGVLVFIVLSTVVPPLCLTRNHCRLLLKTALWYWL